MIPHRLFPIVLTAVLTTACFTAEVATEPAKPSDLLGRWEGKFGQVEQMPVYLLLHETGGVVSGGGTIQTIIFGEATLVGRGIYIAPDLELSLYPGPYQPFQFSGRVRGDTIWGYLNGSGFANDIALLVRQRP